MNKNIFHSRKGRKWRNDQKWLYPSEKNNLSIDENLMNKPRITPDEDFRRGIIFVIFVVIILIVALLVVPPYLG